MALTVWPSRSRLTVDPGSAWPVRARVPASAALITASPLIGLTLGCAGAALSTVTVWVWGVPTLPAASVCVTVMSAGPWPMAAMSAALRV